jgi:alanyl-tRNA synthetase
MKSSNEIRNDFLDFFRSKGHRIVPSAPVIPYNDPTLLFTNAGMNQFKDVFLGLGKRDYKRAANTQKCIRVSGKHNDLDEVGHDGYHHTFFEMLGNWSFGDYYKREAISWAWELLTSVWGIDKRRLWVTYHENDEETASIWTDVTDVDTDHILKFGDKDNFWEMGETGPCGPCTEIHYDFTDDGCRAEEINSGSEKVMEIWNLVFIQYNKDESSVISELPAKHVDTGMGFERIVRVLQNAESNYLTDIFLPLINELIHITGKDYTGEYISPMNVIADHIRSLSFAIADGAIPSNEGRGYVLRRILRRAARYGRSLDMHEPFIYRLALPLSNLMGDVFPEIRQRKEFIEDVIKSEEESFNLTLDRGLQYFNDEMKNLENSGSGVFSGEVAFRLHDTYGFPVDLTELLARERNCKVDIDEFNRLMHRQKEMARGSRDKKIVTVNTADYNYVVNYDPYSLDPEGITTRVTDVIKKDNKYLIVLETNPFYAESGGQVSDTGKLILPSGDELNVSGFSREFVLSDSDVPEGITVRAKVNYEKRLDIQRNHSATHLVHEALRRVLGTHVRQMGSYLDDSVLRFDFSHFHKVSESEMKDIEEIVNSKINEDVKVLIDTMSFQEASKIPNIKMFFGDKYGDNVRVVYIDENFSVELCGGTHVSETGDIGIFKIIKEESVSSGIRRIFAKTGRGVVDYLQSRIMEIETLANILPDRHKENIKPAIESLTRDLTLADYKNINLLSSLLKHQESAMKMLLEQREKYIAEKKNLELLEAESKLNKARESIDMIIKNSPMINDYRIVVHKFSLDSQDELRQTGDVVRSKLGSGAAVLYCEQEAKIAGVVVVTDDLIKNKVLDAREIAREVAVIIGGGGGGKSHMATFGGKDISKMNDVINRFPEIIKNKIYSK